MKDDQLWQDLREANAPDHITKSLRASRVKTYSECFALLRDKTADVHHHISILMALGHLSRVIDKRRVVPPLLDALKSEDEVVRDMAIGNLGHFQSRRAIQPLIEIAQDKAQPNDTRTYAIQALADIGDARAILGLNQIIRDESENLLVRTAAIEWTSQIRGEHSLEDYAALLSHSAADIRFWVAFSLTHLNRTTDISTTLGKIDQLVAFDVSLPIYWGWQIGREAIEPLELIYARLLGLVHESDGWWDYPTTWLISPVPEYLNFASEQREWNKDWTYTTKSQIPVSLRIDSEWLADRLRENWPEIELNIRDPRPQAYLLDWKLTISEQPLIGGLLRDQYGVVLSGEDDAINAFADWYRSIISPEYPLYLYEWADEGVELPLK